MKNKYLLLALLLAVATAANAKEGLYVEYKMSADNFSGKIKTYALDGNSRTESEMSGSQLPKSFNSTVLLLQSTPSVIYMLDQENKTYTENKTKPGTETTAEDYEVSIVGNETVNGYHCVHAIVRNLKSQSNSDLWLSKDVANYKDFYAVKNKYLNGPNLLTALKAKNADGFVVRMIIEEHSYKATMDLVAAEKRELSPSMFSLDGYTKTEMSAPRNPMGAQPQVDMQKLQNMSEAERKQYIEQLKQKYQNAASGH